MTKNFSQKVYAQLMKVPAGKVTTYKDLAESLNSRAYRAVGTAMKLNPHAPIVPCHRVVKSDGRVGMYSGKGGVQAKIKLLSEEGVHVRDGRIVQFNVRRHRFRK